MRVIARKTLNEYAKKYPDAEQALRSWYDEVRKERWQTHNELKKKFRSASVVGNSRVVFNICGNTYRLVVKLEYRLQFVFVKWFGTHPEYDKINVKTIGYDKTSKK